MRPLANLRMVLLWYRKYAPSDAELERLETEAHTQRRGVWATDEPMPPGNGEPSIEQALSLSAILPRRPLCLFDYNAGKLMRTRIFHIRLKEWFPPEDPIASLLAKLCILREDYLLELSGIVQGDDEFIGESKPTYRGLEVDLDANSVGWRRMYFYRNSLRTLFEIRKETENVYDTPKLREALDKESPRFRETFEQLCNKMKIAADRVERIRHNLGGHVASGAVTKALRDMPHDTKGLFQDGDIKGKKHYKFVGEIVLRMMLPGVPDNEMHEKLEELLDETQELVPVFSLIDYLLTIYILDRQLEY